MGKVYGQTDGQTTTKCDQKSLLELSACFVPSFVESNPVVNEKILKMGKVNGYADRQTEGRQTKCNQKSLLELSAQVS